MKSKRRAFIRRQMPPTAKKLEGVLVFEEKHELAAVNR
jgi:hypothetical protein